MFFLYSLQGLTPLPIELPPSYLGLLNSAHLRFAVQLYKLEFGEHLQSTIYNLQSVELGGLSPADMRVYPTVHAPRFQARAAVSVIPASLITGVSLHSPTL